MANSRIFFTSDTHFGHKNIIEYCNRPFDSVEQMNDFIIKQWNSVVRENDTVYHLGDVCLGLRKEEIAEILSKLNGTKYLVKGNHDNWKNEVYREIGFKEVYDTPIIIKEFLILSHAPIPWKINPMYLNLYGHVHDSDLYETYGKASACLCVERHNYTPIDLEFLKSKYS